MMTKTQILLGVLVFYAFIIFFMSLYGQELQREEYSKLVDNGELDTKVFSLPEVNIITGLNASLSELGWLNALLFTPLIIIGVWIIVSSLPTVNGGA